MNPLCRVLQLLPSITIVILSLAIEPLAAQAQQPDDFVPVTDAVLQAPAPDDWPN